MGFPLLQINWIKECISSPSFSVMINGFPNGFFTSNRSIRQGDPLSPYLFVLAMKFRSINCELAMTRGLIQPINRDAKVIVSHLMFVNDMLIFCHADKKSLFHVSQLLDDLSLNTGLSVTKQKSKIYFSKGCVDRNNFQSIIGFPGRSSLSNISDCHYRLIISKSEIVEP